jgi:hypothetical protein
MMRELLQIESIPAIPDADIVAALRAEGLAVDVIGRGDRLEMAVRETTTITDLSRRVAEALDRLVWTQPRSLVAERLGPLAFSIHPVAA